MTLELQFSPDLEIQLRAQAAAAGQDVSAFVLQAVAEKLIDSAPSNSSAVQKKDNWREQLDAFINLHPVVMHFVDDSRESIYAGRGE